LEQFDMDISEEEFGPDLVAPLPAFLASGEAESLTGNTFGLRGGTLSFYSDPNEERVLIKDNPEDGGWTVEEIAESVSQLTEGYETEKIEPVGL
jgi:hypothetical protein